jgi:triacylglycerol esterase/lipase EstA (alpha/beta hydrolase family)
MDDFKKDKINMVVVILHGITRTTRSMQKLADIIAGAGFETFNIGYPSTKFSLESLAKIVCQKILNASISPDKIVHFVGHSMGAILALTVINKCRPKNLGYVLQIAPPNNGSEIADFLHKTWFYKKIFGPAGQELVSSESNILHFKKLWGKLDYKIGVIAGDIFRMHISSLFLREKHDGQISVRSTKIPEMSDHIILPGASHLGLLDDKRTHRQVLHFLQDGYFVNYYR